MNNDKEFLNKLKDEVKDLEMQLNHRYVYKIRSFVTKTFIKAGLAVDYILPFIVATFIPFYGSHAVGVKPFEREDIIKKASVSTIDTSTGLHLEKESLDVEYNNYGFQYSTGFFLNENGLYERNIISYQVNRNILLKNKEQLFKMTKEEIENIFEIANIEKIQKSILSEQDKFYSQEMLIITNYHEGDLSRIEKQSATGELVDFLCYVGLYIVSLTVFQNVKKVVFKDIFKNNLDNKLKMINDKEYVIDKLQQILKIRKENISLFEEQVDDSCGYAYRLERKR